MADPDLAGPSVRTVGNAILRPCRPGEQRGLAQVSRVFAADGQAIAQAAITARIGRLDLPCAAPDPGPLPLRRGRWLYGGIGFHHFGHALIFSTARLWALDGLARHSDGILFLDRGAGSETRAGTTRNLAAILELLGIDLPVVTVARDERVEELIVPEEGISTAETLFSGTPAYRRFIRARLSRPADPMPVRDLYLSRTGLGANRPGLMFEDRIEAQLAAEGYTVLHPQDLPLAEQVRAYRGARRIVGVDGSALHLAAFAAPATARVAVLGRRPYFPERLARQVTDLAGCAAVSLGRIHAVHVLPSTKAAADPWQDSFCLPDMAALAQDLTRHGFRAPDAPPWPDPAPDEVAARLRAIARRYKTAPVERPDLCPLA